MASPHVSRSEDEIRDHLARNLDLFEPGLTLVKKEKFLRNDKGATGFVDLFARSAAGHLVVIEIKRSDVAARQAVQELIKYVALVKQNLLVKETEVRLIAASTEWHELLVPFSEFVRATRYALEGRRIVLGLDGLPTATEVVELAPAEQSRQISRRHFIWGFDDDAAARAAIPILAAYMEEVGLKDFLIALIAIRAADDEKQRFLYFAQQELTYDVYMQLIRNRFSPEVVAEFEDYVSDLSEEEDRVSEAADKAWEDISLEDSLFTRIGATHAQIAHPEKARHWFSASSLISIEVVRFGRFVDPNLSDETIVSEIVGSTGESFHHGDITADLNSKPETDALLRVAENLFFFNPIWRLATRDLCDYARRTGAQSLRLRAFSNDDILRALAGLAIGYPGYLPRLELHITRANELESFVGVIEWHGRTPDLSRLIDDHFSGDGFQYFMARHMGANRAQNADLMADLGLAYNIARSTSAGPVTVRVHGASVSDTRLGGAKTISSFLQENAGFLKPLIDLFLEHEEEFGRVFEVAAHKSSEARLDALKAPSTGAEVTYWLGNVDACDLCHRDLTAARFMVDGAVRGGAWTCMCALCFHQGGGAIAWGKGQLYEKDQHGWLLVGGGPPLDEF